MHWTWWPHQMETSSALLAICAGNSPPPGKFPTQRPVTRSFDVFFDLRRNKRLNKQWWGWWFETLSRPLWRPRNVATVVQVQLSHCLECSPLQVLMVHFIVEDFTMYLLQVPTLPWWQGSGGQHGAHLGPTGPRWAPCWPHELCYLGIVPDQVTAQIAKAFGSTSMKYRSMSTRCRSNGLCCLDGKATKGNVSHYFVWYPVVVLRVTTALLK